MLVFQFDYDVDFSANYDFYLEALLNQMYWNIFVESPIRPFLQLTDT